MKIKLFGVVSLACFALMLQACSGTYKTVVPYEEANLYESVDSMEGESCVTIPRVYSGTFYNYCVLTGQVSQKSAYHCDILQVPGDLVADTILLPYTIYRQAKAGGIVLKGLELSQEQLSSNGRTSSP